MNTEQGDYVTMREIGGLFSVSSHVIGRHLKALGLRTAKGSPSQQAFDCGLVEQRCNPYGHGYCWAWHQDRTIALLQAAGLV